MARVSKDGHGVWTMTLDETDAQDRNAVFDEAVPRYLTAFDPAFVRAAEPDEAEFVKAPLRIRSLQETGWDPNETTLRTVARRRGRSSRASSSPRPARPPAAATGARSTTSRERARRRS